MVRKLNWARATTFKVGCGGMILGFLAAGVVSAVTTNSFVLGLFFWGALALVFVAALMNPNPTAGQILSQEMRERRERVCPHCRSIYRKGATVCHRCGRSIIEDEGHDK